MPQGNEVSQSKKHGNRWKKRYAKKNKSRKAHCGTVINQDYMLSEKPYAKQNDFSKAHIDLDRRTFRSVSYLWLESNRIRLKESTYMKYKRLLDFHILPQIGDMLIHEIDATYINRLLFQKSTAGRLDHNGGLSATYVRAIAFVIKSVMIYAARNHYCAILKEEIVLPPKPRKQLEILNLSEQITLENLCFENTDEKKLGILLSLYTGMRVGEVCGLQWEDIDIEERTIHIHHTVERIQVLDTKSTGKRTKLALLDVKSVSSDRIIPIPSKLLPLLSNKSAGFLIKGREFDYTDPRTMQYFLKNLLRKCNIKDINYHALRHTFATRCIEAGMDIKSLSEILGHADVGITLGTYIHSSIEHKRAQLELMLLNCDRSSCQEKADPLMQ